MKAPSPGEERPGPHRRSPPSLTGRIQVRTDDQRSGDVSGDRLLLTTQEAADVLRVGRTTVYALIKEGQLLRCTSAAAAGSPAPNSSATSAGSTLPHRAAVHGPARELWTSQRCSPRALAARQQSC
ncbi:helix-turn-helix domain-containing protein [Modestobacter marinus]|uniref:helix-turn-helix domain-containing protein n=1 Tax=Modestobacter marinus TaxID=477641 RepID=UPI0034D4424A